MKRALAVLAVVGAVLAAFGAEPVPSAGVPLGGLSIEPIAGYNGFALPVANSALGRAWAAKSGLAWQLAYNYSTVPIRIKILHRFPFAFHGLIEVETAGYARAEAPGGQMAVYSREVLVPPSVPTTIYLAPRVCPQSSPGRTVRLDVRITQLGTSGRLSQQVLPVTVTQLEPAHLYSLLLDGTPGRYDLDVVNAANNLQLEFPADLRWDPALLESANYTIPVEREMLTQLPLAARDFAFVLADLSAVNSWPAAQQLALAQFVIAGGHLCLFNATAGVWQGLPLGRGAQLVGRGLLLPVAGGYDQARQAVTGFLEGEVTEFVLWTGGSCAGRSISIADATERLTRGLDLSAIYGVDEAESGALSHRPGFLHPVWLYRESCNAAALEPWDYPEFSQQATNAAASNRNLTSAFYTQQLKLVPMAYQSQVRPAAPLALSALLLCLPLLIALLGCRLRPRWVIAALTVAALSGGAVLWWRATPAAPAPLQLRLVDADLRCRGAAERVLLASYPTHDQALSMGLPAGALVRRVAWNPPGPWRVDETDARLSWSGRDSSGFVALAYDSPLAQAGHAPVSMTWQRIGPDSLRMQFDTSRLPTGQHSYLLTPLGWTVLAGGLKAQYVELNLGPMPAVPGYARLAAWDAVYSARPNIWQGQGPAQVVQGEIALRLNNSAGARTAGPITELERLGYSGLLQQPCGLRGLTRNQCVLFIPLEHKSGAADFMRLSFPLEPEP